MTRGLTRREINGRDIAIEHRVAGAAAPASSRRAQAQPRPRGRGPAPHSPSAPAIAASLREIASRVRRLTIRRRDADWFHEERSEIAHDLDRLAAALDAAATR